VSLMTVHTAKGLEFPWVFLTGLEENIFPHARSVDDESAIEEERRLCYVAVTRAMQRLFLSRARRRRLAGQELGGVPSRFLRDLPSEGIEVILQPRPAYLNVDTNGAGPWAGRWNRGGDIDDRIGGGRGRAPARSPGIPPAPPRAPATLNPATTGQVTVHYDEDESAGGDGGMGLRIGARLRHPQFGVGEVRGWQSSGADLKVTMRFASAGIKTILARFLTRA
jgi:DNA helicase-2/ATP-dependent DNA helicase PcrA